VQGAGDVADLELPVADLGNGRNGRAGEEALFEASDFRGVDVFLDQVTGAVPFSALMLAPLVDETFTIGIAAKSSRANATPRWHGARQTALGVGLLA
jgi:hypothetical protein